MFILSFVLDVILGKEREGEGENSEFSQVPEEGDGEGNVLVDFKTRYGAKTWFFSKS